LKWLVPLGAGAAVLMTCDRDWSETAREASVTAAPDGDVTENFANLIGPAFEREYVRFVFESHLP
jgi:hypothetical protein